MNETAEYESLLAQRFSALTIPATEDWSDVHRRARRTQARRLAFLAVALVVFALAATPALGIGGRLLDLIQGPPAPSQVQDYFAANDATREKMIAYAEVAGEKLHDRFSRVIATEARGVFAIDSPDGPIYLWAAPTEDGRQCWLIQGGAEIPTGRPYGLGSCDVADQASAVLPEVFWTAERPGVEILHARIYDDAITRLDVDLEDAQPISLPVLAGHALGTVPGGTRVLDFVGRNADGVEVSRITVHPPTG
jgi:hypothetical protein